MSLLVAGTTCWDGDGDDDKGNGDGDVPGVGGAAASAASVGGVSTKLNNKG